MDRVSLSSQLLWFVMSPVLYSSIQGDFPNDPVMWDALARRPWDEVDTSLLSGSHSNDHVIIYVIGFDYKCHIMLAID